jgi:hypothetical protein
MLLTVCIEAGRSTLTHTSWTVPTDSSRKWMSGQAAALATPNDRWPFANLTASHSLRDPTPPSARRPPSPIELLLIMDVPGFPPFFRVFPLRFPPDLQRPHSLSHSDPASNIPTLNFAKNAKFRMGHPGSYHLRGLQVTLNAAKLGARVGAIQ